MPEGRYVQFIDTKDHKVYVDREGVAAVEEVDSERTSIRTRDGVQITVVGQVEAVVRSLDPRAGVPEWSGA